MEGLAVVGRNVLMRFAFKTKKIFPGAEVVYLGPLRERAFTMDVVSEQDESPNEAIPNMEIWQLAGPTSPNATKKFIRKGGFSGTAINAQWLIMQATRVFGPCGGNWGWTIKSSQFVPVENIGTLHMCEIVLWYTWKGLNGQIPAFGHTPATMTGRDGEIFIDDEAPKKSLTDAITKALSYLGFGADVRLGLYDDNKYIEGLKKIEARETKVTLEGAVKTIEAFTDAGRLKVWWFKNKADIKNDLSPEEYDEVWKVFTSHGRSISEKEIHSIPTIEAV